MLITLSRRTAISTEVAEVWLIGVTSLEAVSPIFSFLNLGLKSFTLFYKVLTIKYWHSIQCMGFYKYDVIFSFVQIPEN